MTCLIIGNHTQGLGIVRSLSDCSCERHLINDKIISISRYSRYLTMYHFIKRDILTHLYKKNNSEYLLQYISDLVPEGQKWVVFGINEDITHFLYENKQHLRTKLSIPENDVTPICDKYRFAAEIEKIGLLSPKTYLLNRFDENFLNHGSYVSKGRIGNKFRNISNTKGMEIKSKDDLIKLKRYTADYLDADEVLLQKKISRNDEVLSFCGFAINGDLYNEFQYVKIRQHPNEFGTGTFLKSIKDYTIYKQSVSIIKHFAYTGIFEIEFVKDFNGNYYIIEMNPRTWKSIHFATLCGQNLCTAYLNYMDKGIIPEKNYNYFTDKTWVDLGTDIPMLIKNRQWAHPGYDKNTFFCVLNQKDPLPFLMEILMTPFISLGI